ncbi:MAG: ATP-binding cassette domain-containing protein, partial [Dehalococcoidia bacterium]
MAEVLRVENLQVEFETNIGQVKALNGISFTQEEDQVYCLVGESGAGKSTLALAIMGILPPSATVSRGRVIFDGVDLLTAPQEHLRHIRGKDVSLVFQDAQAALNPVQPVGSQLEEVILAHTDINQRSA